MRRTLRAILIAALALGAAGAATAQELGGAGPASLYGVPAEEIALTPSAYDLTAVGHAGAGSAVAQCKAGPSGVLADCEVMLERGSGFGAALLRLAPRFQLKPKAERPAATAVVISASWPVADINASWRVPPKDGDFATTATDASWRYGKPGLAVMNCMVGKLGTTYQCMVVYQDPIGKGFGTMALRFAAYLRLKPATVQGKPVVSGVNIPFNFGPPVVGAIN